MSSTVEDVFASGDLPRAAETLANMRHCLSAVGEVIINLTAFYNVPFIQFQGMLKWLGLFDSFCQVAEFANVRKQLEVLEDRLDTMVQPRLTDALNNRKVTISRKKKK